MSYHLLICNYNCFYFGKFYDLKKSSYSVVFLTSREKQSFSLIILLPSPKKTKTCSYLLNKIEMNKLSFKNNLIFINEIKSF